MKYIWIVLFLSVTTLAGNMDIGARQEGSGIDIGARESAEVAPSGEVGQFIMITKADEHINECSIGWSIVFVMAIMCVWKLFRRKTA